MNIRRGLIYLLIISFHAQADDMIDSYNRAKSSSSSYSQKAMTIMKTTPIEDVPGYQGKNVQEINYGAKMTTQESAKTFALSDQKVMAEYDSAKNTLYTRDPMNNELLVEAENIAEKSENHMNGSGFCTGGDCQDFVDIPNNEMIQTTVVLEDVLGGGQSYSQSGKEARIYGGKKYKCKKYDLGVIDCCQDRGILVMLGLYNCKDYEIELSEKKEEGLCHKVGKYNVETTFGHKTYESYCCFTSKMAKLTHEDGRPQIGFSWGRPKYPNCQGFTPDQFSRIDFSKVNLDSIYADIKTTNPNTSSMQNKPSQYIDKQGIASW